MMAQCEASDSRARARHRRGNRCSREWQCTANMTRSLMDQAVRRTGKEVPEAVLIGDSRHKIESALSLSVCRFLMSSR